MKVYAADRIAKEIQSEQPDKLNNIFFGIGGFHLGKIAITCCEKYLEESGIESTCEKWNNCSFDS